MGRARVGDKVYFPGERYGYTVQAAGKRYAVCTKPFNLQRTVLYTVIDWQEQVRGTENLVFGMGAETREQCEEMLARLEGRDAHTATEVSHRNRVPLVIREIRRAPRRRSGDVIPLRATPAPSEDPNKDGEG